MATAAAQAAERAAEAALPEGFHADSKISNVSLETLNVDRSYQRDVSMTLVEQIRNNWDEVASELILVSQRADGTMYIVNGQHRTAAAALRGEKKIWARVVQGLSPDQEAALRLKTNVRLSDRPLERFRAQLAAGDPESLAIMKILDRVGTEPNVTPTNESGINCISTIEFVYRYDEGATLLEALEFLKETFGEVGGRTATASLIRSVAWFILRHKGEANFERAQAQLKGMGPAAFDRHARTIAASMGGPLWLNYYRSLVELYNEGLTGKGKLEWRTRGAQKESAPKPFH
jgi:hypothetical protein